MEVHCLREQAGGQQPSSCTSEESETETAKVQVQRNRSQPFQAVGLIALYFDDKIIKLMGPIENKLVRNARGNSHYISG